MEYVRPPLSHVHSLIVSVYEQLVRSRWKQDVDLYIRRGGHFVIRMLQDCYAANGFRIPAVGIDSSRYVDLARTSQIRISLPAKLQLEGKKVLVVDDVADEGATLIAVREKLIKQARGRVDVRLLTLYKKPWARLVPDYWAEETDRWIVFPWEPFEVLGQIVKRKMSAIELEAEVRKAGFDNNDITLYLRVVELMPTGNNELKARAEAIKAQFSSSRHG